jgi:hypothetical protein
MALIQMVIIQLVPLASYMVVVEVSPEGVIVRGMSMGDKCRRGSMNATMRECGGSRES